MSDETKPISQSKVQELDRQKAEEELKNALGNVEKSGRYSWHVFPSFLKENKKENEIVFQLTYNGALPEYQREEMDFQLGPNWLTIEHRAYYSPKYSDDEVAAWKAARVAEKTSAVPQKITEAKERVVNHIKERNPMEEATTTKAKVGQIEGNIKMSKPVRDITD